MGLAGMGDLIVTCTSQHSRNRTFGEAFAHGETLKEYQDRRRMVVEGAAAARSVSELAVARASMFPSPSHSKSSCMGEKQSKAPLRPS